MTSPKLNRKAAPRKTTRTASTKPRGIRIAKTEAGHRSGLEDHLAEELIEHGVPFEYESTKIKFTKPAKPATYLPDFVLPNGIIIEGKGRFLSADRQKHLLIRDQHPHLDIRFVFSRSAAKINKGSQTTYADWCRKHNFMFADHSIPQEWIDEAKA